MKVLIGDREEEVSSPFTPLDLVGDKNKRYLGILLRSSDGSQVVKGMTDRIEPKDYEEGRLLTFSDPEGREIYWHTSAHILAQAVKRLFPDAKLTIGPPIESGFYYDIDHEPFTPEDLKRIEDEMVKIIKEDLPIVREEITVKQAREMFKDNPFKLELIDDIVKEALADNPDINPDEYVVSVYRQGEFVDLCRGPHLPSTGYVGAVKLTKVSGAYWRGDARNKVLQRVYGISFPTAKELREYLHRLEEAAKRDHRKIGAQMKLFTFREEVGAGFHLEDSAERIEVPVVVIPELPGLLAASGRPPLFHARGFVGCGMVDARTRFEEVHYARPLFLYCKLGFIVDPDLSYRLRCVDRSFADVDPVKGAEEAFPYGVAHVASRYVPPCGQHSAVVYDHEGVGFEAVPEGPGQEGRRRRGHDIERFYQSQTASRVVQTHHGGQDRPEGIHGSVLQKSVPGHAQAGTANA